MSVLAPTSWAVCGQETKNRDRPKSGVEELANTTTIRPRDAWVSSLLRAFCTLALGAIPADRSCMGCWDGYLPFKYYTWIGYVCTSMSASEIGRLRVNATGRPHFACESVDNNPDEQKRRYRPYQIGAETPSRAIGTCCMYEHTYSSIKQVYTQT